LEHIRKTLAYQQSSQALKIQSAGYMGLVGLQLDHTGIAYFLFSFEL